MDDPSEENMLLEEARALFQKLTSLPLKKRVRVMNSLRLLLHAYSPFRQEPVDCVLWLDGDRVKGNDYNQTVAPPEMRLLARSIEADGYTQPIVAYQKLHNKANLEIVDGFHRKRVGTENRLIRERLHGFLPVTLINACVETEAIAWLLPFGITGRAASTESSQ
jgi:hypothetical protein